MRQAPLLSTHADANSHEIPHERKWRRMISSHAKEDLRVHPVHDAKKALSCLWKTVALSTCLPETFSRQHRPLFHPLAQIHLCHLVMSWERLSRVVFCLNIVQLHYFVLLFFFFSAGSVPHFPYAKPLLVLHGNDHSVARQRICVFGARGCEICLNWLNFTLNARQSVALV